MLYFLLVWIALLLICSTIGLGFLHGLNIVAQRASDRWILSIWLGMILLATVLLGFALFTPLSPGIGLVVAASLVGLSLIQPQVRIELRHLSRSIGQLSQWTLLLCGTGILLLAAVTTRQVTWIDTGLYHYSLIQWLGQAGVVPGLALIFENLGFNSAWFALAAPLSPSPIGPQVTALLGGWVLLVALLQAGVIFRLIRHHQATLSDWFLGTFTLLLLLCSLGFSNLREIAISPSPDVPVGFLTGLVPWSILVIQQVQSKPNSERSLGINPAIIPLTLSVGAVTLKLIALPLLAIGSIFYLFYALLPKGHRLQNLGLGVGITVLLLSPFLLTQIQTSGCPFFPSDRFCLDLPSAVSADLSQSISQLTHNWLSWYRIQQGNISLVNAFLLWLAAKRLNQLLVILAIGSLVAIAVLYQFLRRYPHQGAGWIIATQIICIGFHAVTTLFFRFALPSLLLIPALLIALYGMIQVPMLKHPFLRQPSHPLQKLPSAALALSTCLILLVSYQNNWPLLLPPALQPVDVTLKHVNDFPYFSPNNKDELCWGTQIPCAFEIKPDVKLRDPDRGVAGGFVRLQAHSNLNQ